MNALKKLSQYCVGTAESEEGLGCVDKIFVESPAIDEILSMCPGSPKLLVGNKGNGKTLIMSALRNRLEKAGVEVLYVTPSDILGGSTPNGEEPAVLRDFYFKALVCNVAARLGARQKGLTSGVETVLSKAALNVGERTNDLVEKCLDVLSKLTATVKNNRDLMDVGSNVNSARPIRQVENAVIRKINSGSALFYVFLDEPDDVGTEDSAAARLWALLNACREFSRKVKNLRCVVSLRTEMWYLLVHNEAGRKNIDHFEPLLISINPGEGDLSEIVEKRLLFVAQVLGLTTQCDSHEIYSMFFEGREVRLPPPAKDEMRSWKDYILKSSRARPRDAIQLIKALADNAYQNHRSKIESKDVLDCAAKFSRKRLELLGIEYDKDFPGARQVCEVFSGYNFAIPTEELKEILATIIGTRHVVLRGRTLNRKGEEDIFLLWNMLFQMGFINPCVPDARQTKNFRHMSYDENDLFVSQGNYQDMCKYTWEIHPAYRAYLYTLRDNEISRVKILNDVDRYSKNKNFIGNVKGKKYWRK